MKPDRNDFSGEVKTLSVSLWIEYPMVLFAFVLGLLGLAILCAYGHRDYLDPPSSPSVPVRAGPVSGVVNPPASAVSEESIAASSTELLIKVAQVLCCTSIEFEEASAKITTKGQNALEQLVPFFAEHLRARLFIDGHTDKAGSAQDNLQLSLSRAQAARELLVSRGVLPTQLTARGFGADQPVVDHQSEGARERNRRIEFRL